MIRLNLEKPPSVNALFSTDWKTKRRFRSKAYENWLSNAETALWMTKWKPITGPVNITITVEDAGRVDLANHEKSICDFLVKHGLIEDDKRSIVRKITLQWGNVKGCVVEVVPA